MQEEDWLQARQQVDRVQADMGMDREQVQELHLGLEHGTLVPQLVQIQVVGSSNRDSSGEADSNMVDRNKDRRMRIAGFWCYSRTEQAREQRCLWTQLTFPRHYWHIWTQERH